MIFRAPSRIQGFRSWLGLAAVLVLVVSVLAVGGYPGLDREGPRTASASSDPVKENESHLQAETVKKQYIRALAEYYSGEYSKAGELFARIASQVPGYLSDDIQFWQAECAFRQGDLKSAETGFETFLNRRPQGARTEIALNRLSILKSRSN